jgi:hypothetical protein
VPAVTLGFPPSPFEEFGFVRRETVMQLLTVRS